MSGTISPSSRARTNETCKNLPHLFELRRDLILFWLRGFVGRNFFTTLTLYVWPPERVHVPTAMRAIRSPFQFHPRLNNPIASSCLLSRHVESRFPEEILNSNASLLLSSRSRLVPRSRRDPLMSHLSERRPLCPGHPGLWLVSGLSLSSGFRGQRMRGPKDQLFSEALQKRDLQRRKRRIQMQLLRIR